MGCYAMVKIIQRLVNDKTGASAIEYGLIAAFITAALLATLPSLRQNITGMLWQVNEKVSVGRKMSN